MYIGVLEVMKEEDMVSHGRLLGESDIWATSCRKAKC